MDWLDDESAPLHHRKNRLTTYTSGWDLPSNSKINNLVLTAMFIESRCENCCKMPDGMSAVKPTKDADQSKLMTSMARSTSYNIVLQVIMSLAIL